LWVTIDLDPVGVDGSGRFGLQSVGFTSPSGGDLAWGAVAEPGVGSVVVVLDVLADLGPCVLDGLPLGAPGAALLELSEPGLDERLGLGVAVAAAAVGDTTGGQVTAEVAAGELAAVVRPEGQSTRPDTAGEDGGLDAADGLVVAAAQLERPAGDLAGAAVDDGVQVDPAVRRCPHLRHVEMPQLIGPGDPEEPRPAAPLTGSGALQQPVLAHHPLRPLAVHRLPELPAREGGDHPGAIGRVRFRDLDDRRIAGTAATGPGIDGPSRRPPVDRLAGHSQHARHDRRAVALGDQGAGPGDALAHSQPRKASPATSSS
jgi:hypothetical protein